MIFKATFQPHAVGGFATSLWEIDFHPANGVRRVFAVRARRILSVCYFLTSRTSRHPAAMHNACAPKNSDYAKVALELAS